MKRLVLLTLLFTSITSFSQMTMNGVAAPFGAGCGCYQITTPTNGVAGAIWSPSTIDLNNDFDFTFQMSFGNGDIWAGDGMGFVLQENATGLGSSGNGLGFAFPYQAPPISNNNFIIEIDQFNNSPAIPSDVGPDHIGMDINGSQHHGEVAPTPFPANQEIGDGAFHEVRIAWNSTLQIIAFYWEGNAIPLAAHNIDLINTVFGGNSNVYWGWTGGTGGVWAEYRVCINAGTAGLNQDLLSVCPGLPVQFTDASTGDLNYYESWAWDFGDGSPIDNTQNPSHIYNAPGTYTVTLDATDAFGCTYQETSSVTVLDSITMNMSAVDVTCFGDTDGQVTSTPTNGTGPYNYLWDDPGPQTTQTATGLAPGWYVVEVIDNLGCVGYDSVEVMEPLEMTLNMDSTLASCNGGTDGTATATPVNGVSPYNYLWNDTGSQTTQTATGLGAGMYTVTVTDDDGCTATDSVEVIEATGLVVDIDSIPPTCNGGSNGAAFVNVISGVGPYTYVWDDPMSQTTDTASALTAGQYIVTVTGSGGCFVTDTIMVTEPPAISATVTGNDALCYADSTGDATVVVTNGTAPYNYLWDDPSAQTTATASNLPAGTYNVSITDVDGCTASGAVTIGEPTEMTAGSNAQDDLGSGGQIDVTVLGGTTPYTYSWDSGESTEDITGVAAGTYTITITDANGCTLMLSDTVNLILDLDFPTAISPNADGMNDTYVIIGIEAHPENSFTITNRWGNVVYKEDNYSNSWDGNNMNGEPLPEGVYFMVFEAGTEQHTRYVELRR